MKIYELGYKWYEDYHPRLFTSDKDMTKKEWGELCDSLLHQATIDAIAANHKILVGWPDITRHICLLLESSGFKKIEPIEHSYWGTSIITREDKEQGTLSSEDFNAIKSHNDAVDLSF